LWNGCWHNLDHFLAFHVEIGHIFLVTLEWYVSQDSTWDVLWMWEEDVSWWAPFCNWYFLLITTCNMGFTFFTIPSSQIHATSCKNLAWNLAFLYWIQYQARKPLPQIVSSMYSKSYHLCRFDMAGKTHS
jgi:hypothetical protein